MAISNKSKILSTILFALIIAAVLRSFVIEGFIVKGDSMEPNIHSEEYIFINRIAYLNNEPKRGDIVIANPREFKGKVVKRIVGLPGERFEVENGKVTIRIGRLDEKIPLNEMYLKEQKTDTNGIKYIRLDPGEYFALGDNREVSIDSRELGPLDRWNIKGKVIGSFNFKSLKYRKI